MKRIFAALVLLFGFAPLGFANVDPATAASKIADGRAALVAHDLPTARTRFTEALGFEPANQTAAVLLGVTRVFGLTAQAGSTAFLDGLAVPAAGRDVYNWTAQLPESGGNLVLPANYNLTAIASFWQTTLIPETAAARANFALVTDPAFLLTLNPAETTMPVSVTIDYGDVLMARASLSALEFVFHFLSGQNLSANLAALNQLAQGNLLTLQKVLADNPDVLTRGSTSERASAQASLNQVISRYREASTFIRTMRPAGVNRLFMLDAGDLAQEADFRAHLDKIELSLTEPVSFDQGKHIVFTKPLLDPASTWALRSQIPAFNSATGGFDFETVTDPSLGGVIGGVTRENIANLFNSSDTVAELGWTWLSPTPQGNSLLRVVSLGFSNLIATGAAGTILRSADDGVTWTAQRLRGEGGVNSVATNGDGRIVLVSTGALFVSTDGGGTWTRTLDNLKLNARAVTYGGGKFVTVGGSSTAMTSSDGSTWTKATVSGANPIVTLNDVRYTGTLYVAVGGDHPTTASAHAVVFTSSNGTTWTNAFTAGSSGYTFNSVALNATADKFVVVGSGNHIAVATNPTATWTEGTVTGAGVTTFNGVAFRNGVFIAVGTNGTIATTADGSSWSTATSGEPTTTLNGVGVSATATFVAASNGRILKTTDSASAASYTRLLDPARIAPLGTSLFGSRTAAGKLFVVGAGGTLISYDGSTVTTLTSGTPNDLRSVSNKQGTIVYAVGDAGTVIVSTNTDQAVSNWNPDATTGIANTVNLRSVSYLGGRWVITGSKATLAVSTTEVWSIPATLAGATSSDFLYDVAYGSGTAGPIFVAVGGNNAGTNYVYTSTDAGVTWTRRTVTTASTFSGVVFNQGYFTAVGSGGAVFRSADGITWSSVDAGTTYDLLSLRVSGGRYYAFQGRSVSLGFGGTAVTQQTAVLISSDGLSWTRIMTGTANQLYSGDFFGGQLYAVGDNATVLRTEVIPGQANPLIAVPVASLTEPQGVDRIVAAFPNGDGGETYEWRKNGSFVAFTKAPALELKNLQSTDAGSYVLKVTNAAGLTASPAIVVTVDPTPTAPSVTQPPASQSATVGQAATFSVVANGTTPFTYQWKKNGANLSDGAVVGSATVSGATTATLTLTGVQSADIAGYTVLLTNAGGSVTSALATLSVVAPGANVFASRLALTGKSFSFASSNTGASKESGEPNHAGNSGGKSVWWSWTAPNTGFVTIDTIGSDFNTLLAVYTGNAVASLTPVPNASDDDSGSYSTSKVTFNVTAGTVYQIAVDGFGGASGNILLNLNYAYAFTTFAGGLGQPHGVAVDSAGNVYVGDNNNNVIYKISPAGVRTTLAGSGTSGFVNGTGSAASFSQPNGVAVDAAGNVYVSEYQNGALRKITPGGVVTTMASGFASAGLWGVAVDAVGNAYLADAVAFKIWKVTPTGVITTVAGTGVFGNDDGPVASATLSPVAVAVDAAGTIFFVSDNTVRKVSTDGIVSTVAGATGGEGFADGIGGAARFDLPHSVAVDGAGNLYVGDRSQIGATGGNVVRKITPAGLVTTLGGLPHVSGSANGIGAAARFTLPWGIAVDGAGNVYVGDGPSNNSVRKGAFAIAPQIQTQPATQTVALGGTVTFTVGATSGLPVTYQWQKGGVNVAGAVSATLAFNNLEGPESGNYTVIVSNLAGSVTSSVATLTVQLPPAPNVVSMAPTTVTSGASVTLTGTGFTGATVVRFNGLAAAFTVVSATSITATVPLGVTSGPLTVVGPGGTSPAANYTAVVTPVSQTLYVATGQGGSSQLFTVNPDTAATTLVGNIMMGGDSLSITGLAFNPLTGVLYGVTDNSETGPDRKLVTINPANGLATLVGSLITGDSSVGSSDISFDVNGKLYTWRTQGGPLGTINLSTGAVTAVGSATNGSGDNGLAFTPDGTLYVAGPPTGSLFRVNPATGALTSVGSLTGVSGEFGSINAMASSLAGVLYAVLNNSSTLVTINSATGAITTVGDLSFSSADAIAFAIMPPLPVITAAPANATVNVSGSVTLSFAGPIVSGQTFQWLKDGVAISGATNSTLTLSNATSANAGVYSLAVTTAGVTVISAGTTVAVIGRSLLNLTSATSVPAGGSIGTSFTIEGGASKQILIRGLGPALAFEPFSLTGVLADPELTLFNASGVQIGFNDDWGSSPSAAASAFASVGAVALANASKDAALLVTLAPGTYTARLDGVGGAGGQGMVEIYDVDTGEWPRLVMLTMRGFVTGDHHLFLGFNLTGPASVSRNYLLRVMGPSLGFSNGVLIDPMIRLFHGTTQIGFNDDWRSQGEGAVTTAVASVGAQPSSHSYDSALLVTLAPGTYTAGIEPYNPSTESGEALFEIFNLDSLRATTISPAITYLARNQAVLPGETAYFGVNTVAKPAATFQWRKYTGGVPGAISGATAPILTIGNVQAADVASYDVVVTSGVTSITSPVRTLSLLPAFHSADTNHDGRIDLVELTRVLQLYNYKTGATRTGEYHSQTLPATEDGYAPGPGAITTYHSADSNHDGRIDFAELSRVIQLYNVVTGSIRTGQYHAQSGTEDGFALGLSLAGGGL